MYSVWLKAVPTSSLHRLASALIEEHAAQLQTPRFVPHVTLLGGFSAEDDASALRATRALAATLRSEHLRPVCRMNQVQQGPLYYQCVYILMEDSEHLCRAHAHARLAFNAPTPSSSFMPHMSIVYGELDAQSKAACAARVASAFAGLPPGEAEFTADELALWRTPHGETETWSEIALVPL